MRVLLEELIPKSLQQMDMLHPKNEDAIKQRERMMVLMDAIDQKYGASTLRLAAEGFNKTWSMKAATKIPALHDLLGKFADGTYILTPYLPGE